LVALFGAVELVGPPLVRVVMTVCPWPYVTEVTWATGA
jgi:hypothetical protein